MASKKDNVERCRDAKRQGSKNDQSAHLLCSHKCGSIRIYAQDDRYSRSDLPEAEDPSGDPSPNAEVQHAVESEARGSPRTDREHAKPTKIHPEQNGTDESGQDDV